MRLHGASVPTGSRRGITRVRHVRDLFCHTACIAHNDAPIASAVVEGSKPTYVAAGTGYIDRVTHVGYPSCRNPHSARTSLTNVLLRLVRPDVAPCDRRCSQGGDSQGGCRHGHGLCGGCASLLGSVRGQLAKQRDAQGHFCLVQPGHGRSLVYQLSDLLAKTDDPVLRELFDRWRKGKAGGSTRKGCSSARLSAHTSCMKAVVAEVEPSVHSTKTRVL